jgi:hypothetical protein
MPKEVLSSEERYVMRITFKVAMIRAAEIVESITAGDVLDMQARLLAKGISLENVAKLDRAMLGATHLRAIAADLE